MPPSRLTAYAPFQLLRSERLLFLVVPAHLSRFCSVSTLRSLSSGAERGCPADRQPAAARKDHPHGPAVGFPVQRIGPEYGWFRRAGAAISPTRRNRWTPLPESGKRGERHEATHSDA